MDNSLSSSPEQDRVTLHIRKAGWWTKSLYDLARTKDGEPVEICMEGPYGSVGVDLQSDKYGMVLLFSGGIGVTPMQSICHQLMYEHNSRKRNLKKLTFVWTERDPQVFDEVDVVRCSSSRHFSTVGATANNIPPMMANDDDSASLVSAMTHMATGGDIATTLLSTIPQNRTTDAQLLLEYPMEEFQDLEDLDEESGPPKEVEVYLADSDDSVPVIVDNGVNRNEKEQQQQQQQQRRVSSTMPSPNADCRVLEKAYGVDAAPSPTTTPTAGGDPLDLRVYLTSRNLPPGDMTMPPFVHYGRPDVKDIFRQLRQDAIEAGERRIAVCVCAPMRLVTICRKACAKYSDRQVTFDFHYEVFD